MHVCWSFFAPRFEIRYDRPPVRVQPTPLPAWNNSIFTLRCLLINTYSCYICARVHWAPGSRYRATAMDSACSGLDSHSCSENRSYYTHTHTLLHSKTLWIQFGKCSQNNMITICFHEFMKACVQCALIAIIPMKRYCVWTRLRITSANSCMWGHPLLQLNMTQSVFSVQQLGNGHGQMRLECYWVDISHRIS